MEISAYILCGGKSSRMGSDKALMPYNNQTFIDAPINALKINNIPFRLVSSHKFHHDLGFSFINDIQNEKGPVSGVTSALKNTTTDWNMILSCDTPLLKMDFLEWLLQNNSETHDATICIIGEKKMPLTAIYHNRCCSVFEKHLQQESLRVMDVIEDLNVNYISVPYKFQKQLANINTPKQLKAISI